ncbi:MAG: hypothetical protein M3161_00215, partial [Actinomycetota bacterium]|nr:hypothetical protein [Actinomycetota bacterium]
MLCVLLVVLSGLPAVSALAQGASQGNASGYVITLKAGSPTYGAGTTTFTWVITNTEGKTDPPSHILIQTCLGAQLDANGQAQAVPSPTAQYGQDGSIQPAKPTGWKWNNPAVGSEVSLTFQGIWLSSASGASWWVKKGNNPDFVSGTTGGPDCNAPAPVANARANKTVSGTDAPAASGWSLQLKQGATVVSTITSDADQGNFQTFKCPAVDCVLTPGATYTIEEVNANTGGVTTTASGDGASGAKCTFTVANPVTTNTTYSCTFNNQNDAAAPTFEAKARADKTVSGSDAPSPSGWSLQLKKGATVVSTISSDGTQGSFQTFQCGGVDCVLTPGNYTIEEVNANIGGVTTTASGDGASGATCSFTVPNTLTANTTYSCTFNNHKDAARPTFQAKASANKTVSGTAAPSASGWELQLKKGGNVESTITSDSIQGTSQTFQCGGVDCVLTRGNYTIEEVNANTGGITTTASGDGATGATCSFTVPDPVPANTTYSCTFNNHRDAPPVQPCCTVANNDGTLIVEKQTIPDGATRSFTFAGGVLGAAGATLADGQTTSVAVAPGVYTVSEMVPFGWDLSSITCTDSNTMGLASSGDVSSATATFRVDANDTVRCVFTNTFTPDPGTIVVVKQTNPNGAPDEFEFVGDLSGDISDGESLSATVAPGSYSVSESATDGWELTDI